LKLRQPSPSAQRFTVSELAARSGMSTASIKFYLREKLLPPGDLSAAGKAYYDGAHLSRLSLIRALRELAKLPVERVRRVLSAVDRDASSTFTQVASVIDALATRAKPTAAHRALRARVYAKLRQRGLVVRESSATLDALTAALHGLRAFRPEFDENVLDGYLDHLLPLAEAEFRSNEERLRAGAEPALIGAVVGTVLFEPLILTLRRLAHEHYARELR
jgi:DNA-binding transcriptional MerR regulator